MRLLALLALVACTGGGTSSESPDLDDGICEGLESCGVGDYGWNFRCVDGEVRVDDLTEQFFCEPGSPEIVCRKNDPRLVVEATCPTGCNPDQSSHYAETLGEYQAFDRGSMCLP